MVCQYDRDVQCLESCDECSRHKYEYCDYCDGLVDKNLFIDGMCQNCFLDKKTKEFDLMKEFLHDNEDINEKYVEYLKEVYFDE